MARPTTSPGSGSTPCPEDARRARSRRVDPQRDLFSEGPKPPRHDAAAAVPGSLHRPPLGLVRIVTLCPRCGKRKRMVIRLFECGDASRTCCGCGVTWVGRERQAQTDAERRLAAMRAKQAWPLAAAVRTALLAVVE